MPVPLLVFRVGYMPTYDGAGPITGGGSHIKEHGEGGEMWNFRIEAGHCYGYVMTRHFSGINLARLESTTKWNPNDELDGVDIVFIAKKPNVGQVVVGWYKGATVFHKGYRKRRGKKRKGDWDNLSYLCQVDAENIVLLPDNERTFEVPYAPINGKGWPGQSNVWYPHSNTPDVKKFVTRLRKYIGASDAGSTMRASKKPAGWKSHPNKDLITQIEQAAILATKKYFRKAGYTVISVEKDNRGWDLEVTRGKEKLLVEVKGHIGNVIQFELTPNEYTQLQCNAKSYRVCVVRQAIDSAEVEEYSPEHKGKRWVLVQRNGGGVIALSEKVGAKAFESV